ncbi:YciI family protein [Xanthomonas campestris pv. incanae]|uniref:YciI family protein n=1 Tax=Xanthomonas campestris TaxID=339 RepID=UPI0029C4EF06|nr:YciI family protein [Xanthomonas campestris]MDX6083602.1 YciI family protein [Xanthomonas campestris pv. incanae]MDX6087377.1 YciI family protein [Xanthomonas campestris pv. incanae]MDX6141150.1 YciI family protein [Xanthomonas campestris pv. incanae]
MQFRLLVYLDATLLDTLPDGEADSMMRHCFANADVMHQQGQLLQAQQLEPATTARSVRVRGGAVRVSDGPFAETKEVLGGFNLIEATDMDEALRIAATFPWAATGCIEVRPVRDMHAVRRQVGAPAGDLSVQWHNVSVTSPNASGNVDAA